jgi:plastocyanin
LLCLGAQLFLGAISLAGDRATAGDSGKPANEYQATIQDFSFQPPELTVPAGAKVVWTNKDQEPHTVVSTDNAFKSKALDTDKQFSFTFDKPGTYEYFCSVHPRMTGKIIVK